MEPRAFDRKNPGNIYASEVDQARYLMSYSTWEDGLIAVAKKLEARRQSYIAAFPGQTPSIEELVTNTETNTQK
jgi:hypothetical protein